MIAIQPMKDREEELRLLETVPGAGENAKVLMMNDGEDALGWAAVEVKENVLHILKLTAGAYDFTQKPDMEQIFILDTLMRSAASFGENNGADAIETAFPDFFDFFKLRGFTVDDTHAFTDMSTIVKYN